jgi:hypothetical protein
VEGLDILSRNLSGQALETGYGGMSEAAQTLTVVIPLLIKPRGGRKSMVTPGLLAPGGRQEVVLIKAVARAFRWRGMLESGAFATIKELAAAEKINSSYLLWLLRLTLRRRAWSRRSWMGSSRRGDAAGVAGGGAGGVLSAAFGFWSSDGA